MTRLAKTSRNYQLTKGVNRYSRSATIRRKRLWAKKLADWKPVAKEAVKVVEPKVKDFQNGKRTIAVKAPRFYPAEDVKRRLYTRKNHHKPTKLRSSITPGTVLILLAGRFRGKRVIFLKQLPSGLLLVTGPYKVNGVPARRVNQAYVIATSTIVDIGALKIPEAYTDEFFKRPSVKQQRQLFAKVKAEHPEEAKSKASKVSAQRVDLQKHLDSQILHHVKAVPHLHDYLHAKFSLRRGQYPHQIKF